MMYTSEDVYTAPVSQEDEYEDMISIKRNLSIPEDDPPKLTNYPPRLMQGHTLRTSKKRTSRREIILIIVIAALSILTLSLGVAFTVAKLEVTAIKEQQQSQTTAANTSSANSIKMAYWKQENIQNFLKVSSLPALEEFTLCFYYEPIPGRMPSISNPEADVEALISIASETQQNAFLFGFYRPGDKPMMKLTKEPENLGFSEQLKSFMERHRHCFVWKRNSYLKWFFDMHSPGVLELVSQIRDTGTQNIPAKSTLVLLNDQDSQGGSLDSRQMVSGYIADFQMWYHVLSNDEVRGLGCSTEGNLLTFNDLEIVGTQQIQYDDKFKCLS